MLPVRVFIPNVDGLKWLLEKCTEHAHEWALDIPQDPIEFTALMAGGTSACFTIGDKDPLGIFLFTEIMLHNTCLSHVLIWGKCNTKDLVMAARRTIAAIMEACDLHRVNGVTPVTHPLGRRFAHMVGFKEEGLLREVVKIGDTWHDGWLNAILRKDMIKILANPDVVQ